MPTSEAKKAWARFRYIYKSRHGEEELLLLDNQLKSREILDQKRYGKQIEDRLLAEEAWIEAEKALLKTKKAWIKTEEARIKAEKNRIQTVINLLKKGMSVENVAEVTGFPIEKVVGLKQHHLPL